MTAARLLNSTKIFTVTFFLLLIYLGFTIFIRQHSTWITPLFDGSGSSGYPSVFLQSLQFLPGMLKNQETADQKSSELKKLME